MKYLGRALRVPDYKVRSWSKEIGVKERKNVIKGMMKPKPCLKVFSLIKD
jgi:hypothetical protein